MTSLRATPRGRRVVAVLVAVLAAVLVMGSVVMAAGDRSSVTRPRLERSLPLVFSHLYADQAALLGHPGITPESIGATAMCDKHGADVADVGPGGDWVCLMGWTDPDLPMPAEGYGKFELNVHSNDCWTASGPSKLTGFLTVTDTAGQEVANPVFEFDGCFDPGGDDTPTGIHYPSLFAVTSTTAALDATGRTTVQVSCGTGSDGCAGSVTFADGDGVLATVPYALKEETTRTLTGPAPGTATTLSLTVTPTAGVGPGGPVSLPVQQP